MRIDLTHPLSKEMMERFMVMATDKDFTLFGHFGTHFDVMDKEFPLEYCERNGKVFDVSAVKGRDIESEDFDISKVEPQDFVILRTATIETVEYGSDAYFNDHPQLSQRLIRTLVDMNISLLGFDMSGVRRGLEHVPADQFCADHNIFIIENLCDLDILLQQANGKAFKVHTYPSRFMGYTGLPCRVIAEFE